MNRNQTLDLVIRLIKTFKSPAFQSALVIPWSGSDELLNISVIQNKLTNDLVKLKSSFELHNSFDRVQDYLNFLCQSDSFAVRRRNSSGLVSSFGYDDYRGVQDFVCDFSSAMPIPSTLFSGRSALHSLLEVMCEYLLSKDTIENGCGHPRLDKVIRTLIATKPAKFFINGYISDLLVRDRVSALKSGDVSYVLCRKDYLRTQSGATKADLLEPYEDDIDRNLYHLFNVA